MSRLPAGQFIPGQSPLHRLRPGVKLVCFAALTAAVVLADGAAGYAVIIGLGAACAALSGLPVRTLVGPVRRLWLFFVMIFLMNTLFFDAETPLWRWWIFRPSVSGMAQGANVVLRVALVMVLSTVLTSTTAPMELTGALVAGMRPLARIGVPVEDVAMIISVSIQFIPTLLTEAEVIRKAQTARGARFESRRLRERALSVSPLVVPIFLSAFRKADELALAMEARGYRTGAKRIRRKTEPLRAADCAAMLLCAAVCAVEILLS